MKFLEPIKKVSHRLGELLPWTRESDAAETADDHDEAESDKKPMVKKFGTFLFWLGILVGIASYPLSGLPVELIGVERAKNWGLTQAIELDLRPLLLILALSLITMGLVFRYKSLGKGKQFFIKLGLLLAPIRRLRVLVWLLAFASTFSKHKQKDPPEETPETGNESKSPVSSAKVKSWKFASLIGKSLATLGKNTGELSKTAAGKLSQKFARRKDSVGHD